MTTAPQDTAIPIVTVDGLAQSGITKREYFAALAMQGWVSACTPDVKVDPMRFARASVTMADALIKALNE